MNNNPLAAMLDRVVIVLVETTHSGNIGGVARAMKNMGLRRLRLANAVASIDDQARARAAGADDILEQAGKFTTLAEALADCQLAFATSARPRRAEWPVFSPESAVNRVFQRSSSGPVAFVFGRESAGLNNRQLDICQHIVNIDTDPEFGSLNLAASVQVIAYVLRQQYLNNFEHQGQPEPGRCGPKPVTIEQMERFHQDIRYIMQTIDFIKHKKDEKLLRKVRLLFSRRHMNEEEYNILMGFLAAIRDRLER